MNPTTFLLIRHGATAINMMRPIVLQGRSIDPPLVDLGRQQANAVANAIITTNIDAAYNSPLIRAKDTAERIINERAIPWYSDDRLIEADIGLWEGLSWVEIEQRWPAEYNAFHDNSADVPYLGGENFTQVLQRVLPFFEETAAKHPGETVVVVSHNVVFRVLMAHWMGIPIRFARKIPQNNGGINLVTAANGSFKVHTINAIGHLSGLLPVD